MAQEIITRTLCDVCLGRDDSHVDGSAYQITVARSGERAATYDVDLCETDSKAVDAVVDLLSEHGRREGKTSRPVSAAPAPVTADSTPAPPCPVPGCGRLLTAHHARDAHGVTVPELDGTATMPCPEPGCDRKFTAPQGVSRHRMSVHGFRPAG